MTVSPTANSHGHGQVGGRTVVPFIGLQLEPRLVRDCEAPYTIFCLIIMHRLPAVNFPPLRQFIRSPSRTAPCGIPQRLIVRQPGAFRAFSSS